MFQNRIHIVFVKKAKHLQLSVDSICVSVIWLSVEKNLQISVNEKTKHLEMSVKKTPPSI
jgi:hypothetical protein